MSEDTVVLRIIQARNLPKSDLIGTIDSYIIFKYGAQEHKTATVENNKNPVYGETETWNYDSSVDEITFEVYDWDKHTKDDKVGSGKIKVADYRNNKKKKWIPVTTEKGKKAGEIELEVVWNAPVEAKTRSFDLAPSGFQQSILDYLKTKPAIEQVINFVYTSVILENLITYAILAVLLLGNYFISVSTEWRTSVYLILLAAELYVVQLVIHKFFKYLDQEIDTVEQNTNTVINYLFSYTRVEVKNPLDNVKPLEKFQQTPYYGPTVVIVGLLLLALVSGIFSGSFVALVAIVVLLVAPGLHTKGYDTKFVNWWTPNVHEKIIKPQWDKNVKPYIDQYVYGIKPEPAIPAETPASS